MDVCTRGVGQALLVVTAFAAYALADLSLTAIDSHVVRCEHSAKIVACQFKSYPFGGVVQRSNPGNGWLQLNDDNAINGGTCSVTLSSRFESRFGYLIACRVRDQQDGPWTETEQVLISNADRQPPIELAQLKPSSVLKTTLTTFDGNITLSVTGNKDLANCTFFVPGQALRQAGTSRGDMCSATIHSVVAPEVVVARVGMENGFQWALLETTGTPDHSETFIGTFNTRPFGTTTPRSSGTFRPVLTLTAGTWSHGDVVKASCRVPKNREVVWTLDSETIAETDCRSQSEWLWSFQEGSCVATLDHEVTWRDNGRRLGCRVNETSITRNLIAVDDISQPLNVLFAPRFAGVTLNWFADQSANVTLHVPANPEPKVTWTFAGHYGNATADKTSPGKYYIDLNLAYSNASSKPLVLTVTLENSQGSTTSQFLIGPPSDTTWLVVLSGVLGALCLVLLVAVLVLVLPRWWSTKPGAASRLRLKEVRGRCKAVESGIYAEVDENAEYDDIWQSEYDGVDLPPAQPMRPPKNLAPAPPKSPQNDHAS